MIGYEELVKLRSEGFSPDAVFIRDLDSEVFKDAAHQWNTSPNCIDGGMYSEILMEASDDVSKACLNACEGLPVYINGNRSKERLRALFKKARQAKASLIVACVDEEIYTYIGEQE